MNFKPFKTPKILFLSAISVIQFTRDPIVAHKLRRAIFSIYIEWRNSIRILPEWNWSYFVLAFLQKLITENQEKHVGEKEKVDMIIHWNEYIAHQDVFQLRQE